MSNKKSGPVSYKKVFGKKWKTKDIEKKLRKRTLTLDQGSKLLRIATQEATLSEVIRSHQMTLNALLQKKKGILEAFDLPVDSNIQFDEKTFEVKY